MGFDLQFLAIDSGGTFTDVIGISDTGITVFKIPSTPTNPEDAVKSSIERMNSAKEIFHGTTVATNAILERKGANVVLVTTKGFADVIEIGRQNRDDIYALYPSRTEPLVPQENRIEVAERVNAEGEVILRLTEDELSRIYQKIRDIEPDAIAISCLFSFLNSDHEDRIAEKLTPIASVSKSSYVHPEYREYERTSTTVVDAYVKPIITQYLQNLAEFVTETERADQLAVMKSDRGLGLAYSVADRPVDTIFSGLAGGVKAAEFAAEVTGINNLLTIDIGGTSTDVSIITNGKGNLQQMQKLDNLPVSRPAVDVITIGAGGGSLVTYEAGLLRVGPQSAGADPGPIAYDQGGTIPTVTDVDLVMGLLPNQLAGDTLQLNVDRSYKELITFSKKLDLDLEKAIEGIRRIFHENIAGAIRSVSTQRGHDPRDFTLLAFGGAGPVHATEIAEVMNISKVLIPPYPGVWSSMGLLGANYQYSSSAGLIKPLDVIGDTEIESYLKGLKTQIIKQAVQDKLDVNEGIFQPELALRFIGQSFEIRVPYQNLTESHKKFIEYHRELYGFAAEDEPVELVAIGLNLTIPHESPTLPQFEGGEELTYKKTRKVLTLGEVPVYEKKNLPVATFFEGPSIIEQDDTTIWIPPKWSAKLDNFGFIHIQADNNETN